MSHVSTVNVLSHRLPAHWSASMYTHTHTHTHTRDRTNPTLRGKSDRVETIGKLSPTTTAVTLCRCSESECHFALSLLHIVVFGLSTNRACCYWSGWRTKQKVEVLAIHTAAGPFATIVATSCLLFLWSCSFFTPTTRRVGRSFFLTTTSRTRGGMTELHAGPPLVCGPHVPP